MHILGACPPRFGFFGALLEELRIRLRYEVQGRAKVYERRPVAGQNIKSAIRQRTKAEEKRRNADSKKER